MALMGESGCSTLNREHCAALFHVVEWTQVTLPYGCVKIDLVASQQMES